MQALGVTANAALRSHPQETCIPEKMISARRRNRQARAPTPPEFRGGILGVYTSGGMAEPMPSGGITCGGGSAGTRAGFGGWAIRVDISIAVKSIAAAKK